jgi:hypothetical protein
MYVMYTLPDLKKITAKLSEIKELKLYEILGF